MKISIPLFLAFFLRAATGVAQDASVRPTVGITVRATIAGGSGYIDENVIRETLQRESERMRPCATHGGSFRVIATVDAQGRITSTRHGSRGIMTVATSLGYDLCECATPLLVGLQLPVPTNGALDLAIDVDFAEAPPPRTPPPEEAVPPIDPTEAVFAAHAPDVDRCYLQGTNGSHAAGQVQIELSIGPGGDVVSSRVERAPRPLAAAARCMAAEAILWQMPRSLLVLRITRWSEDLPRPTTPARLPSSPDYTPESTLRIIRANHWGSVRQCYRTALRRSTPAELRGRVLFEFEVGTAGRVQNTTVRGASDVIAPAGRCIARAARDWTLPAPRGASPFAITVPLDLSPSILSE